MSFGKRIGDGTTEAVDRLAKVGAAEQLAVMRVDVVRAREKLEDGTYGICDRCGALISEERLEARPWSVLCVRCASGRSRGDSCPLTACACSAPILATPLGWFALGLVEFVVVVGMSMALLPDRWPVVLQAALVIAAFVALVVFNLWLQRRLSGSR